MTVDQSSVIQSMFLCLVLVCELFVTICHQENYRNVEQAFRNLYSNPQSHIKFVEFRNEESGLAFYVLFVIAGFTFLVICFYRISQSISH